MMGAENLPDEGNDDMQTDNHAPDFAESSQQLNLDPQNQVRFCIKLL